MVEEEEEKDVIEEEVEEEEKEVVEEDKEEEDEVVEKEVEEPLIQVSIETRLRLLHAVLLSTVLFEGPTINKFID